MNYQRVSEKILDTINEISDGKYMYVQDLKKNTVRWSKAAQEYFGLESEYMTDRADHWFSRVHPRDLDKYKKELNDVIELKKDSLFILYHIKNAKGNYVLCRSKGKIIRTDDGEPIFFAGSISVCTGELIYDSLSGLQNANGFTKTINKYNDEGTFYYETLNGRDVYGKQVLNKMNTLTVDGSKINKYDFFDSDDVQKSITGVIAKNVATLLPIFTPIGTAYSALTIAILSMLYK